MQKFTSWWILVVCYLNRTYTAIVLMELYIKERDECCLCLREMFNGHWRTLTIWFFSSRSWSSPLLVIQTRTWIRPRNSLWLVSICYCSIWNAGHLCLKDRGQVSGGGEWCPATEACSSESLLQHSGISLYFGSNWGFWSYDLIGLRCLFCPCQWLCMCIYVCVFIWPRKEPSHGNLMVTSEPNFSQF